MPGEANIGSVIDQNGPAGGCGKVCGNLLGLEGAALGQRRCSRSCGPVSGGDGGRIGRSGSKEGLGGTGKDDKLRRIGETSKLLEEGSANASDS